MAYTDSSVIYSETVLLISDVLEQVLSTYKRKINNSGKYKLIIDQNTDTSSSILSGNMDLEYEMNGCIVR